MEYPPAPPGTDVYTLPFTVHLRPRDDIEPGMWEARAYLDDNTTPGKALPVGTFGFGAQRAAAILMVNVAELILKENPPVREPTTPLVVPERVRPELVVVGNNEKVH